MAIPYSRTIFGSLPWYSVLIVSGIALAIWLAGREEKRLGLPKDTAVDLALVVVPCGIVGARLYYAAMNWQAFSADPWSVLRVWEGGIAIYGAVIGGAIGAWVYARQKKQSFGTLADIVAPGLLLAQAIGRWGNYFNMEAYGPVITDEWLQFFPMAVLIPQVDGYAWHAATFFYESVWNLCGFAALWMMRKKQSGGGRLFAWYLIIYGSGRFIIEQLRQDSLYLGPLRVSQYLSLVLCIAAGLFLLHRSWKDQPKQLVPAVVCLLLWVTRWAFIENAAVYALLMLSAGICAVWLARHEKSSLVWLTAALCLDGFGLLSGLMDGPVQLHTVLCSVSLPVGLWAISKRG